VNSGENELLFRGLEQICEADKTAALLIKDRFVEITELLNCYIDEIERFNSIYGLVKVTDRNELIVKHILDSLAPLGCIARLLEKNTSGKILADLGSGAGLPGIPLAVCIPQLQVVLIERMGRRAGFLRNTAAVLNSSDQLVNITVEETEYERAADNYDIVTFRALSPLTPAFIKKLGCHGTIAAYKGKHETAAAELGDLQGYTTELIPITVPFLEEERCLAVINSNLALCC
jgi:16S rRNA (guanine527-N7)-methyltransferase